jgi:hypothetical protein
MLFQGTYKSPFYRKLHSVLHEDLDLRRRIADCKLQITDFDEQQSTIYNLQSAIDQLNTAWFELGRMEERERNAAPTLLVRQHASAEVPDLSKEWN